MQKQIYNILTIYLNIVIIIMYIHFSDYIQLIHCNNMRDGLIISPLTNSNHL